MSVAPQPLNFSHAQKRTPSSSAAKARKKRVRKPSSRYKNSNNVNQGSQLTANKIKSINSAKQKQPAWLVTLLQWQSFSSWLTSGLILIGVAFYVSLSSSQQQWAREYRKLQELEQDEYELANMAEIWQNHLAQEAIKSESGLVAPTPTKLLFLRPSAVKPPSAEPQLPQSQQIPSQPAPLAY